MRALTSYVLLGALALSGCSKGSSGGGSDQRAPDTKPLLLTGANEQQVLKDVPRLVILPTYQLLAARANELNTAVQAFKKDRSAAALDRVKAAWSATRSPWEQSEAFLFGPVEDYGYDNAIDSWPLNKTELSAVINSDTNLAESNVNSLPSNQRGFHTAEFLIFGEDSNKQASQFSDRELEYLDGTSANLNTIAKNLAASWASGVDGKAPFQDTLSQAGQPGNTIYPSRSAALQELVAYMAKICHEVGASKIATPFDARDPNLVESQFSYNSLKDFADNIRSVNNMYTATNLETGEQGSGITALIAGTNPDLDAKVKGQIKAAIAAIQAIPEPFPKSLKDPANDGVIKAAQKALNDLELTLSKEVQPLFK